MLIIDTTPDYKFEEQKQERQNDTPPSKEIIEHFV
jgi:hypothetical protein